MPCQPIFDSKVKDIPENCLQVYLELKEELPMNGISAITPRRMEYMIFTLLLVYILVIIIKRF